MSFDVKREVAIWRLVHDGHSADGSRVFFTRSRDEKAFARMVERRGGNGNGQLSWSEVDDYERKYGATPATADLKHDVREAQTQSWFGAAVRLARTQVANVLYYSCRCLGGDPGAMGPRP